MTNLFARVVVAGVVALTASASAAEQPPACTALRGVSIAHATIQGAESVTAGAFTPPVSERFGLPADYSKLPAFCRVTGSIHPSNDSDIRFELWLPLAGWNGKFLQTGNGGAAGAIVYSSLAGPLARGYAVANTDTGHRGAPGDFAWALGHPEKLTDYAYRAVHELTVVAKSLVAAAYGRAPEKSYWSGCSTGGRQGLKEAQRYPDDYDGIIAGAPASNFTPLMALSILTQRGLTGRDGFPVDKLPVLKEAAIAACDLQDGVADRVISEPARCGFDPASLACQSGTAGQCLSETEVTTARRLYRGVVTKSGTTLIPGTGPASEPAWAAYASPVFSIGTSYFRYAVAGDPDWDLSTFDLESDVARADRIDGGDITAMDPDLDRFFTRGGRLITYHGTTDGLIPYGNSVRYFESVVSRLGRDRVNRSARLYLLPGVDHCGGGEGAFIVDWLDSLEKWVENDAAPGALVAAHPPFVPGPPGTTPAPSKPFTRAVCPYPQVAVYNGRGDPVDHASFTCAGASR